MHAYGRRRQFGTANRITAWLSAAFTAAILCLPLIAEAGVPNPTITGPIPATVTPGDPSRNYPFFATDVNLAQYGYVEQEYFMQGTANQYTTPAGATGAVISTGNPYKTRLLVRRPISPSTFNGTVLLEWYNVTGGLDAELDWFQTRNYLLAHGYAWIGVSAQMVGVNYLRTWSPAGRYATLDVTVGGTITDDSLSYDIFSQAGQAILNPSGVNLLPGLTVQTVIPTGDSQSASRLSTYINSVHPLNPIFGGFFLHSSLGNAIRTDLGNVKVFKFLTETDILELGEAAVRRPDTPNFVTWETAGTSHADYWGLLNSQGVRTRDATPLAVNPACPFQLTRSRILAYRGQDAAYDHMVQWMQNNTQPPSGTPLELSAITPSVVPVRDVFDNILGGIRLPDFAVPTATDTGFNANTPALPGVRCFLYGQYIPFDTPTIRALYPTHGKYLLDTVTASNVDLTGGYLLDEDAAGANATAAESSVGGTSLRNLNLSGVNLMGVSLPNESLVGDNLTNANLSNSTLQGTNLKGVVLTGANLAGANLIGAALQGANLQGANLTNANLGGATSKGASLGGVTWSNTVCPDGTNSDADGNTCLGHLGSL
jgi:Alpha/beta hydrolase domain/Pentapeptide repeats (8 copies)